MFIDYIVYGAFGIYSIVFMYYQVKTLNKREDLKGNYDPFGFMYVLSPSVLLGFNNEYPENQAYTRLYSIYSKLRIGLLFLAPLILFYFMYISPLMNM